MADRFNPLSRSAKIVNEDGTPSSYFMLQWQLAKSLGSDVAAILAAAFTGGTGINVTGNVTDGVTVSLRNTVVTPGSYGAANKLSTFTVDQQGRMTAAGEVALAATNVAYDNSVSLLTATQVQAAIDELKASAGSGGGVNLIAGSPTSASNALGAFATGASFMYLYAATKVVGAAALINPSTLTETFVVAIYNMTGAGGTLGTLVASAACAPHPLATNPIIVRGIFSSPVTLLASRYYAIAIIRTDVAATGANRLTHSLSVPQPVTVEGTGFVRADRYACNTAAGCAGAASGVSQASGGNVWVIVAT